MNTLKVGDKVRVVDDLDTGKIYISTKWFSNVATFSMVQLAWEIVTIDYISETSIKIKENGFNRLDTMLKPIQSSTVKTRPTYQRKAERSDGVVFEKTAIWWRTLKEIEESIQERKDSIKADEQLLRSHRSLFSKK